MDSLDTEISKCIASNNNFDLDMGNGDHDFLIKYCHIENNLGWSLVIDE